MTAVLPWLVMAVVGGVVLVLVLQWRSQRPGGARAAASAGRIDALVAAGDLTAAARVALDAGRLDVAFDLFLRAKDPASAAMVAVRRGDLRRAANLYEQVGDWEQAIAFYDQVGLHRHADTLRKTRLEVAEAAPVAAVATPAPPAVVVTPAPAAVIAEPVPPAFALEPVPAAFVLEPVPPAFVLEPPPPEAVATRAPALPAVVATPAPAPPLPPTRAAAGALLAEGDITGAAALFAELGLDDEATHLWVNVLGEPGRAAPLIAARGNHQRAAELYELAGDPERAAAAWVDAARGSPQPESFLERIAELSPAIALGYLEHELATRPLSADTAEWHYQKARAVDRGGDARRALSLYLELQDEVGAYRDVEDRLGELSRALQPPSMASRTRRSSRGPVAPIELPLEAQPAAAPAAQPVTPPEPPPPEVDRAQLQQLAAQAADAAVDKMRRRSRLSTLPAPESSPATPPAERVAGLEHGPLDPGLLDDSAVQAARRGPTLETLQRFAEGRSCDLGNIEVFYRIGLSHQALGNFDDALAAFDAVNEASPGYRDATRRIEDLRGWKEALARSSRLAASDAAPGAGGGRYELRGELGRGRIAVVYRAYDHHLRRDVALKLLSEALSSQGPVRELFQRQAEAAAALSHPNLVTVHDAGVLEGRAFIAMELVDGQPVETLMREPGGLTIVESLRIMKQVLDGLTCLHGHAILHHDIRPASIMRTASGLVKVMDAGLAMPRTDGHPPAVIGGTRAYMAPELLAGPGDIDPRTDIFAAAVTLFEMLANKLPYPGGDRQAPPLRLATLVPAVPAQLDAAIMRGLAVDRDQRWRTAAELGHRIGGILTAVNAYVASRRSHGTAPRS